MKRRSKNSGFTLIELMIVIGIMVVLIAMVVMGVPALYKVFRNYQCNNNLRNIKIALAQYETKYKTLPDRGGDLFLAKLYLTGDVTDWDVFICPADKSEDGAGFALPTIDRKCPPPSTKWIEYEEYLDDEYDEEDEPQKSHYALDVEAEWVMSINEDNRTFEPGEISYAAVWNIHGKEESGDMPEDWSSNFEITSISGSKKKPVVCDDFESENDDENNTETNEEERPMVHGDHVNVLYSNGNIGSVQNLQEIGEESNLKKEGFDALRN